MGNRALQDQLKSGDIAAEAAKKRKANVFDTHGNDAIKGRVQDAKATAQQQEETSLIDTAEKENDPSKEAVKADPGAQRAATDELILAMEKLKSTPGRLAELLGKHADRPGQVQALLETLAFELSMETQKTLLTMDTAQIAKDLGNLVLSSESLKANELSLKVDMLGNLAPILFYLLSSELERMPLPEGQEKQEGEGQNASAAMSVAMQSTIDYLLFL